MTLLPFTGAADARAVASPSASAGEEPAIRLSGVGKTFPARRGHPAFAALTDVDLSVRRGSILGVIGPSGAGKSTLIRLVNGLERPTAGRITLFGEDVTGLSEAGWRGARRGIGMIFQHFNLLSSRTARDNVALPLEIAGFDKARIDARVARLLDLVGLADKAGRYPAELSGGQKQRVGIARALATEPSILLCDEATSALDPETTKSILALLRRINRDLNVTILVITHEIPVIRDLCDDVAVIDGGRIVEQGAVFDVFTAPRHETSARFVEGVTGIDIPAHLGALLKQEPSGDDAALLRVRFVGDHATSPVISRLSKITGADVNILAGRIESIGERPFGVLLISVPSDVAQREASVAALKRLGLRVELAGFVPERALRGPAPVASLARKEASDVA